MRAPAAAPRKRTEYVVDSDVLTRPDAEERECADGSVRGLTQKSQRPALTLRRRTTTERTVPHRCPGVLRRVREDT